MGIQGLWQVLEPTGRPVNIHSLRGKVLAVDVSIWLHQLVKGFRDKDGNPLPNAHLLGVFHRVCKLLNYGIKPVFVFDGGVPVLKRQTLAARRQRKLESLDRAEISRQKILSAYLQQQLTRHAKTALPPSLRMQAKITELSSNRGGKGGSASSSPKKRAAAGVGGSRKLVDDDEVDEDLEAFRAALVAKLEDDIDTVDQKFKGQSSDSDEDEPNKQYHYGVDYAENFSVIQNPEFDTLPLETQHEILFEMQESRKMNSWGKFDKMPKDSQTFSNFQLDRLVKRRDLQKKIQSVQQEMGQRHIHVQNLDDLLKMDYNFEKKEKQVIGSKEDGFVLIKSQEPKREKDEDNKKEPKPGPSTSSASATPEIITIDDFVEDSSDDETVIKGNDSSKSNVVPFPKGLEENGVNRSSELDEDEDEDLKLAIQLSLAEAKAEKEKGKVSQERERKSNDFKAEKPKPFLSSVKTTSNVTLENDTMSKEESSKESNNPIESIQASHLTHCAKFLDTVGFHIPISNSAADPTSQGIDDNFEKEPPCSSSSEVKTCEKAETDSDEDDDEFEEVEVEMAMECESKEQRKEEVVGKPETVATIDLSSISKVALKEEEDIFADIFCTNQESSEKVVVVHEENGENSRGKENDSSDLLESNIQMQLLDSKSAKEELNAVMNEAGYQETEGIKWDSDEEIEADLMEMVLKESKSMAGAEKSLGTASDVPSSSNSTVENNISDSKVPQTLQVSEEVSEPGGETQKKDVPVPKRMITAEYMQAQEQLNSKLDRLHSEKGMQERVATSISDQMQIETQELISLFGIPYIVSPTEAEAQCAFLDKSCLTEGSITDDSDVWLFGGQRVYKNFFSQGQKHVELYQAADILRVLNLSREKLIVIAMLTGSDYSDGIQGVGPVLALEILSEFSSAGIDSFEILEKFRGWWDEIQTKKPDVFSGSKVKEKLRKLKIRPGFPNKAVYEAFMNPSIDSSTEPFKWGNPDLDAIRGYVRQKFGWEQSKCDSFLLPVLKNLRCEAEQSRQLTLDSYISFGKMPSLETGKRKKGSKRIENAVKKLKRVGIESHELNLSSESDSEEGEEGRRKTNVILDQKKQVTNRELKVGKRSSGASKAKKKESLPESSSPSSSSGSKASAGKSSNSNNKSSSTIIIAPKPEVIPQRVQAESNKLKNKQKAIEIFKNKMKK